MHWNRRATLAGAALLALTAAIGGASPTGAAVGEGAKYGSGDEPLVPHRVFPGTRTRVRGSGFPPGQQVLARVRPINCPTLKCTNEIRGGEKTWTVDAAGDVVATFRWPRSYLGFNADGDSKRYRWKRGQRVKIQLCTFQHQFHCVGARAHIARH